MPGHLEVITDSNQDAEDILSTLAEIAEAVHRIDHRTALIQQSLIRLGSAFDQGGVKGLRQALKGLSNG